MEGGDRNHRRIARWAGIIQAWTRFPQKEIADSAYRYQMQVDSQRPSWA